MEYLYGTTPGKYLFGLGIYYIKPVSIQIDKNDNNIEIQNPTDQFDQIPFQRQFKWINCFKRNYIKIISPLFLVIAIISIVKNKYRFEEIRSNLTVDLNPIKNRILFLRS